MLIIIHNKLCMIIIRYILKSLDCFDNNVHIYVLYYGDL